MPRRMPLIALLALTAGLALPTCAAAAPAAAAVPLSVRLSGCTTGTDPALRAATFTASMPALKGTRRMWMRFQLAQRRGPRGAFVVIPVPGWGGWEKSEANRPGFVFTKRVESLLAPAAYRAQVTLRWLDRHGKVQRQIVRTTAACRETDRRADLTLAALEASRAADPATAVYELTIANRGGLDAGAFAVALADGTLALGATDLMELPAHASQTVRITGPACVAGDTLTVTLDPDQVVDERDEANDVVSRPCPLG